MSGRVARLTPVRAHTQYYRKVRTLKDLDVSKEEDKQRILDMLGVGVLNELSLRVLVEGDMEEDSPVERFVEELKKRSHLHFHVAGA